MTSKKINPFNKSPIKNWYDIFKNEPFTKEQEEENLFYLEFEEKYKPKIKENFHELPEIYPAAKKYLLKKQKDLKKDLSDISKKSIELQNTLYNKREKLIREKFFLDKHKQNKIYKLNNVERYLKLYNIDKRHIKSGLLNKEKAKAVLITDYIEFNRSGFAPCIWHKESNSSMKYYKNSNTCYCFGCGKYGDVISVVQKLYNLDFKQAIIFLTKI
jgi:hypothetical protein